MSSTIIPIAHHHIPVRNIRLTQGNVRVQSPLLDFNQVEIFPMSDNEQKFTSLSSITLLVLKELRLERNIHQAQLAEICDKTPSAWTKIETGKTPLTMEVFFRVCNGLAVSPSAVLATAERYAHS